MVQAESNPLAFLRFKQFNVFAAARQIVLYWEYRGKIFGERWLHHLSADTAEAGILNENDNRILESGWIAVATHPLSPIVVILDHSRLQGENAEACIRTVFYLCTVANRLDLQSRGVYIIHRMTKHPLFPFHVTMLLLQMIKRAFPIKISKVICITSNQEDLLTSNLTKAYVRTIRNTVCSFFGQDVQQTVSVTDDKDAMKHLQALDIPKECVPTDLGGEWTYDKLFAWRNALPPINHNAPISTSVFIKTSDGGSDSSVLDSAELNRARNALYSRRSYQKRKAQQNEVEEERNQLEAEKARLTEENQRLEGLYATAVSMVESLKHRERATAASETAAPISTAGLKKSDSSDNEGDNAGGGKSITSV